jgi:CRP-like cAMP-binding protein
VIKEAAPTESLDGREATAGHLVGHVARSGFLRPLDSDVVEELVRPGRFATYPRGTILTSGRDGSGPSLVLSGLLRYYLSALDGRQLTLRYVLPGDLVGTVALEQSDVSTHIEVLEPAALLHLDEEHLRAVAARRPELAAALIDETARRLRAAYRALAARAFTSVRARVARDLMERARLAGPVRAGMHIDVTQQSIADATGTVREVVSRALRELRREGLIASHGDGVTVLDPPALGRAAGL